MAKFKIGDFVKIRASEHSKAWETTYNLHLDIRYQIVKMNYYYTIRSTDSKRPITYKGNDGDGSIELSNPQLDMDEDYIKEKLETLFG